jgi:hypothetical protein
VRYAPTNRNEDHHEGRDHRVRPVSYRFRWAAPALQLSSAGISDEDRMRSPPSAGGLLLPSSD